MTKMHCITRINIQGADTSAKVCFGKGVAQLLKGIQKHHSLNLATKEMGMAYSKAWTILRSTEEALGIQLLYRMGGNGSVLTKEGEELLEVYEEAEKAAQKAAVEVLRSITERRFFE